MTDTRVVLLGRRDRRRVAPQVQGTDATPLGVLLYDHIIVGKEGHASLKGLRLI